MGIGARGRLRYRPCRKVVFSSTLQEPLAWSHTLLVRADPVEAARALKNDGDAPLRTIGSATLCRSLLAAGLVAGALAPSLGKVLVTWQGRPSPLMSSPGGIDRIARLTSHGEAIGGTISVVTTSTIIIA